MKHYVIATKWSEDAKAQVKYIAGEFPNLMNVHLFCEAYNNFYKANAVVVDEAYMMANLTF